MKIGSLSKRDIRGQTVKSLLSKSPDGTEVTLEMKTVNQLVKDKGLDKAGDVQAFHTQNVLRRIKRFMPFVTGVTYKVTVIQTDIRRPEIVTDTPYAKYLFYGKVMIDPKINAAGFMTPEGWRSRIGATKVRTDRNLKYTKTKNPKAGPRWDKALSASDGPVMTAELQRYINRLGRSK